MHPAERYARDVVAGKVVAGELVRLACERHLADRRRWKRKTGPYWFDPEAADRPIRFFPRLLRHSKGEWAGSSFDLAPWQQFCLWNLFGWRRANGTRRFRWAYLEIARKNGKSTFAAGLGLYMLTADGEAGAEVYTGATKLEQARIIHSEAVRMREASPDLVEHIDAFRNNLSIPGTASKYEPLGADSGTLDGLNVSCALIDELHAHKTRGLFDVLNTATGARRQPLIFMITTAGTDRHTICWEQHEIAENILRGVSRDEALFAYVATRDEGDSWDDEAAWIKANPNLNVSLYLEGLRDQCAQAAASPMAQNSFRRYRLNEWTQQETRFVDLGRWDENGGDLSPAEIELACEGELAYAGLDLATSTDMASFALAFAGPDPDADSIAAVMRYWIPEADLAKRQEKYRTPYTAWIEAGWLIATPGEVIDYGAIRDEILELAARYEIAQIAFDPWNATHLVTELRDEGLELVAFHQGYRSFNAPMKEVEKLILSRRLQHGGHPVLRWNANNLEAATDPAGNVKPVKPDHKMSHRRIDGIVALIMAIGRMTVCGDVSPRSVYEEREVIVL